VVRLSADDFSAVDSCFFFAVNREHPIGPGWGIVGASNCPIVGAQVELLEVTPSLTMFCACRGGLTCRQ
jgi:hypothetical protein